MSEASTKVPGGVRPLPNWLAVVLVTVTSAAVLVLEILAGRMLAPYVGVSIETFTSIIGTILAGIAIGAWVGGLLADRVDPRRLIAVLLMLGGVLAIASIPVVRALGDVGTQATGAQSLFLTFVGFFPAAAVLSAVPPAVMKLQIRDLAITGRTVGFLSAWGTAGALFGTFFTGFVLIAAAAVTTLIVATGLLLCAGGLAMWVFVRPHRPAELLVLPLGGLALLGVAAVDSPCEFRTAYYCVAIVEDPDVPTGRTLVLDDLRHSYVDLEDPARLEFWYVRRLVDAVDLAAGDPSSPVTVLHVGGGALTIPLYLDQTRPGSSQTVLEIDGDLIDVVETELVMPGDAVDVVVGDARTSVRGQPDDSVDVVVGDVFGGRSVPYHLTTREFVNDVDRVLRPGGVYGLNVIDGPREAFVRAQAATLAAVFEHVVVIRGPSLTRGGTGNAVLLASQDAIDVDRLAAAVASDVDPSDGPTAPDSVEILHGPRLDEELDGATILTDDYAPVDRLRSGGVTV